MLDRFKMNRKGSVNGSGGRGRSLVLLSLHPRSGSHQTSTSKLGKRFEEVNVQN